MPKNILKIRLSFFVLLFLAILFLLYKAVVPFGEITYAVTPCNKSFFISRLKPKDRVSEINKKNCTQKIIGEPAYFNIATPRTFNEADLTITYRTNYNQRVPIIEVGVLVDEQQNYRLQPLDNAIIDNINWHSTTENGVTLLQREKKFDSLSSFFEQLPLKEQIRTYYYALPTQNIIPDYQPATETTTIDRELRGSYQFYTYLGNENFNFNFKFRDLNRNKDADDIKVLVYHNDMPISDDSLTDNRGDEETRFEQDLGSLKLKIPDLEKGFYKISVIVNDDIVTEEITTSQKIASFINRIWLNESLNTNLITLYSDIDEVIASTLNPAGLQKILINKENILNIEETYRQFSALTGQEQNIIQLTKDDVIISGSGVFSFSPEALYNPNYKKISKATDVDANGVNYIITTYQRESEVALSHPQENSWEEKILHFDLKNTFYYDNAYGFIISIPGLIADDDKDDFVEIKKIEVKLKGRTLWEKLFSS